MPCSDCKFWEAGVPTGTCLALVREFIRNESKEAPLLEVPSTLRRRKRARSYQMATVDGIWDGNFGNPRTMTLYLTTAPNFSCSLHQFRSGQRKKRTVYTRLLEDSPWDSK